jgi:hypothetical protein
MGRYMSGVTESRRDLFAGESVLRLEFLRGSSSRQLAENRRYIDPGTSEAGLSETNCGIHRDAGEHFHICASST